MTSAIQTVDTNSTSDSASSTPNATRASTATPQPVEVTEVIATGPPRRWTEDQVLYFKSMVSEFRKAQGDKSWNETWAKIHGGLIEQWSHGPLTAAEVAAGVTRESKLLDEFRKMKSWFNNHAREANHEGQRVLDLGGKQTKALAPWQAYMRIYYANKLRDVVNSRYKQAQQDAMSGYIPTPPPLVKFRNLVVRELFEAEPAAVHEEAKAFALACKQGDQGVEDGAGDDEDDDEENSGTKSALKTESYLKAQKALPRTLDRALKQILDQTGYVGGIVLAGPDPEAGGNIKAISMFSGTFNGFDWGQYYSARRWKECVTDPLIDFASKVYTPDIRAGFALAENPAVNSKPSTARSKSVPETLAATSKPNATKSKSTTTSRSRDGKSSTSKSKTRIPVLNLSDDNPFSDAEAREMEDDPNADSPASSNAAPLKLPPVKPKPQKRGPLEEWELDDSLTVKERKEIKAEKSVYERERQYNIIRNKRILNSMDIPGAAKDLAKMCVKPPGNGSKTNQVGGNNTASDAGSTQAKTPTYRKSPAFDPSTPTELDAVVDSLNELDHDNTGMPTSPKAISNTALNIEVDDNEALNVDGGNDDTPNDSDGSDGQPSGSEGSEGQPNDGKGSHGKPNNGEGSHGQPNDRDGSDGQPNGSNGQPNDSDGSGQPNDGEGNNGKPDGNEAHDSLGPSLADSHPDVKDWPDWMAPVVCAMEGMVTGEDWGSTLAKWVSFEKLMGYPTGKAKKVVLSSQSRPSAVGNWMKTGRPLDNMPDVTADVDVFGDEWWAWWSHLMNGRLAQFPKPSLSVPSPQLEDTQEVMKGGANGVFLLLLSLGWWGLGACDQGEVCISVWRSALEDLRAVLDVMHDSLSVSALKRPGDELENSRKKRSRKGGLAAKR